MSFHFIFLSSFLILYFYCSFYTLLFCLICLFNPCFFFPFPFLFFRCLLFSFLNVNVTNVTWTFSNAAIFLNELEFAKCITFSKKILEIPSCLEFRVFKMDDASLARPQTSILAKRKR